MDVELVWVEGGTMYCKPMRARDGLEPGEMPDEAARTVELLEHLGLPWMFYRFEGGGYCSNHSAGEGHFDNADAWLARKREYLRSL